MKKREKRVVRSLFSVWSYLVFFVTISFVVTSSFYLFLKSWGIELGSEIQKSAILTFLNVLMLSLIFTIVDSLRRKLTVERPVKRILAATRRLTGGDFTARITPLHGFDRMNEFDAIIEDFNKMAEELGGIETLRSDFIANVSHELKTPLAVMHNYATMQQNPALPDETRLEYAATISDASGRLSELITNILKLNKLENQQIYTEARTYNLGEQLRECLLVFEDAWESKGLNIGIDIDDTTVTADAELLTIVWNNLISNAIKFTDSGGCVAVSLKRSGNCAVVTVSDTGCGMTPEVGRRIFEKFYQGDKSRATRGNGLGLALVRRVVDITGGEILVESTPDVGSTFTVKIAQNINISETLHNHFANISAS